MTSINPSRNRGTSLPFSRIFGAFALHSRLRLVLAYALALDDAIDFGPWNVSQTCPSNVTLRLLRHGKVGITILVCALDPRLNLLFDQQIESRFVSEFQSSTELLISTKMTIRIEA